MREILILIFTFRSQLLILKNKEVKDKKREYEGYDSRILQSFLHGTMLCYLIYL